MEHTILSKLGTSAFCWAKWSWEDNACKLLPRFYDLKEAKSWSMGQTSIVSPYSLLRRQIGIVQQDVPLMERFARMCCMEDLMQLTKK